jgi:hypothetical protein
MQRFQIKSDKKNYNTPVIKKIDSIKNKTLGTLIKGTKDGQYGNDGRHSS